MMVTQENEIKIEDYLEKLGPRQKQAVRLFMNGWTIKQIDEEMGIHNSRTHLRDFRNLLPAKYRPLFRKSFDPELRTKLERNQVK